MRIYYLLFALLVITIRANADSYATTNDARIGVANGIAGLDSNGLVPVAQLPGLPAAWGTLTGTLSAQTDLQTALDGKAATSHTHEAFPVGSVYVAVVSTNPNTLLGYGTWSAFGTGRVLVGIDAGQTEFDVVEEIGGAKTHTITTAEMPAHNHQILRERSATTGGATTQIARTADTSSTVDTNVFTENAGSGSAHNNLQPYIVVYMWKRTA